MTSSPTLTPNMAALLDRLVEEDGGLPDLTTLLPAEGREIERRLSKRWRAHLPEVARIDVFEIGETVGRCVEARRVVPPAPREGTILFLHGGGWAFGGFHTHEDPVRRLSLVTGMAVVALEYRLAPEHPFPAGLKDCIAGWRALVGGNLPGALLDGPLVIAGDSAGANLALSTTLNELEDGRPAPDACILIYGVYGSDFSTPSYRRWGEGPLLARAKMERLWDWYCPVEARDDFRATPLSAPAELIEKLPPLYVAAAEVDPLLSDSENLVRRLSADRPDDQFALWPGLVHGSFGMGSCLPEVRKHIRDVGRWIAETFPTDAAGRVVKT